MAGEKFASAHDEIAIAPAPEVSGVRNHLDEDQEIAQYAGQEAVHIDEETSKKLFWTINRRILAVMLGVSVACS
jgi:hypothetical protein